MEKFAANGSVLIAFVAVSMAVIVVMITDLSRRRVPNTIWGLFALGGLLFHTFAPQGQGLQYSLVGSFLGFGLLFMPFLAGGIATRDLKLTAGVGAWFGPTLTIWVFLCIGTIAGLYQAIAFLRQRDRQEGLAGIQIMYCRLACLLRYVADNDDVPYRPKESELDERLVSYTTAIFLSTLLMLNVIVFVWKSGA